MKKIALSVALSGAMFATLAAEPASVTGTYVEARTAEVFAGACIMNGEVATGGREALLAWKVDKGQVNGVTLDGLAVVAALAGDTNLGIHEVGGESTPARAAIYVDSRANAAQRKALVSMVRSLSGRLIGSVVQETATPIQFADNGKSDHRLDRHREPDGGQTAQPRRELRQQAVVQSADARRPRRDGHDRSERVQRRHPQHEVERSEQALVVLRNVLVLGRLIDAAPNANSRPTLHVALRCCRWYLTQAASLSGVKHSDPIPTEIAAPVAAKVAPGGVRATANGATITFWWVADLPGATLADVPDGTLVGAVKLDADTRDIRGRLMKAGVYTLRYAIQPKTDDHFGVSPFRNFLLLSPAAVDKDPAAPDHQGHDRAVEADPWW